MTKQQIALSRERLCIALSARPNVMQRLLYADMKLELGKTQERLLYLCRDLRAISLSIPDSVAPAVHNISYTCAVARASACIS